MRKEPPTPPAWADRFLEWYCAPHLLEDLQGDLHERFHTRLRAKGLAFAKRRYVLDTINFMRPHVIRRQRKTQKSSANMLRHYFKTGIRNVKRDKQYLVLNSLGLSLGIGCSLLLIAYIYNELSFDRSNQYADRTYRISCSTIIDGHQTDFAPIPPAIGPALKNTLPEIEKVARMITWSGDGGPSAISYNDKFLYEKGLMISDSTVFDVMDYKFILGDRYAFRAPKKIVLTHTLATKIFGPRYINNDKLLQTVIKVDQQEFAIAGVVADVPEPAHVSPNAFISWEGFGHDDIWNDSHAYTYVRIMGDVSGKDIQRKINHWTATNENIRKVAEEFGMEVMVSIEPLTKLHLYSNKLGEFKEVGNINFLIAFAAIAGFFLLMSGINYINLSIAASSHRYREIAVRKVMGAVRRQIQKQFMTESLIFMGIASLGGLLIFYFLLPYFNSIMSCNLQPSLLATSTFTLCALALIAALSLLSGFYPAFFLSGANPIAVFKNTVQAGSKRLHFRKGLLIAQFAISSMMIIGVMVVTLQMNFISKTTLGFEKENILVLKIPGPAVESLTMLKQQLQHIPGVIATGATDYLPGTTGIIDEHKIERANGQMQSSTVSRMFIDRHFFKLLGLTIVEGRNFDTTSIADYKSAFIVNEAAVRAYGWNETGQGALGRKVNGFNYGKEGTVIGVMKDANLFSLHSKTQPLILNLGIYMDQLYIKLEGGNIVQTMRQVESTYHKLIQNYPFDYQFLDERFDRLYDADRRMNRAMKIGAGILMLISCIGLFGLSAFIVLQRTKEIGVRKVLGASIREIMVLLSSEYVKLIVLANVGAVVLSYLFVQQWLNGYAYRIDVSWWLFVIPTAITFILALLSISFQVIRAAMANPVKSLRYE